MESLHRAGMAHRGLRAANVMVEGDVEPWLTDFSFSELAASQRQKDLDIAQLLASLATMAPRKGRRPAPPPSRSRSMTAAVRCCNRWLCRQQRVRRHR